MKQLSLILALLLFLPLTSNATGSSPLDIAITTLDGKTTTLNSLRKNGPLYVKIWASWCSSCMKQMPHFNHTHKQYSDSLTTIGINLWVNETRQAMDDVIRTKDLRMPTLIDTHGELAQAFGLIATPMHILIDQKGRIVHTGHKASAELDKMISLISEGKLPAILPANQLSNDTNKMSFNTKGRIGVLYTATWCDWYFEDTRPTMAKNCMAAQKFMNQQKNKNPDWQWIVVANRLWTGEPELIKYRERHKTNVKLTIDTSNSSFIDNNIRNFPTLLIFENGKEILREEDFSDTQKINQDIFSL